MIIISSGCVNRELMELFYGIHESMTPTALGQSISILVSHPHQLDLVSHECRGRDYIAYKAPDDEKSSTGSCSLEITSEHPED